MMVMTAKVNLKKITILLGALALVVIALTLALGGRAEPTSAKPVSDNEARVQFLKSFGWEVASAPCPEFAHNPTSIMPRCGISHGRCGGDGNTVLSQA